MAGSAETIMQDTARLVRYPSESGNETEIAAHVFTSLREMEHKGAQLFGRSTMIDGFGELDQARSVGILIPGKNRKALFVANGHLDTVSPEEDPLVPSAVGKLIPEQSGRWLYGRGAGDMKAGVAIMLDIAKQYPDGEAPCDIFLSFVDQEETTGHGSLVQAYWIYDNLSQRYSEGIGGVILEPTYRERNSAVEGFVGFGHRGGSFLTVTAGGEGGHGGHNYNGKTTAIGTLTNFIHALPGIQESWAEHFMDKYGVPTINATVLRAGEIDNQVPFSAYASLDLRTTKSFAAEWPRIHADLERQFKVAIESPDVDLSVSCCNPDSRIYQTIEQVMPGIFEVFPFGSDQPAFAKYGIPMVIYGPGDVEKLHGPEDRVHLSAVDECRHNIEKMIEEFAIYKSKKQNDRIEF